MSRARTYRHGPTPGYDPVARKQAEAAQMAQVAQTLETLLDAVERGEPLPADPTPADDDASLLTVDHADDPAIEPIAAQADDPAAASPSATSPYIPALPGRTSGQSRAVGAARLSAPGWSAVAQRAFIEHLAVNGCVGEAAKHVGLSRQSAYQLRQRMPNSMFAMAWDTAMMLARRALIEIAIDRAINGHEVEVWSRGECVGTRVVHNDRMLMFVIGQKTEPVHPALSGPELHQLWPSMLQNIDAILPPVLSEAELKARLDEHRVNGNDDG